MPLITPRRSMTATWRCPTETACPAPEGATQSGLKGWITQEHVTGLPFEEPWDWFVAVGVQPMD
jgi:hypothetical protein